MPGPPLRPWLLILLLLPAIFGAPWRRVQDFEGEAAGTIYSLALDRHGLIWVASDRGVLRFDGAHYIAVPGYPFRSARSLALDSAGDLWAAAPEGLAKLHAYQWTVVLREPFRDLALATRGVWVTAGRLKFVRPDGTINVPAIPQPDGAITAASDGALWYVCGPDACRVDGPDGPVTRIPIRVAGNWRKVLPARDGRGLWVSTGVRVALVIDGAVRVEDRFPTPSLRDGEPQEPKIAEDGRVYLAGPGPSNLATLADWSLRSRPYGTSIATAGAHWFGALSSILRETAPEGWETWKGALFSTRSTEGFVAGDGIEPTAFTDHGLMVFDAPQRTFRVAAKSTPLDVMNLIRDGVGGYWLTARDAPLVRLGADFRELERPLVPECAQDGSLRAILRDGKGRTWIGGKSMDCFFEILGKPGAWTFVPQQLPEATLQAVTLEPGAHGRPWVGYEHGIAYLDDDGAWRQIATSVPLTRVRSFTFDGDDIIWVARRTDDTIKRLTRKGSVWQVEDVAGPPSASRQTEWVRVDSRGWLWRATLREVQVARRGHYAPDEWLTIRRSDGLASTGASGRGYFEDRNGDVWIGGNEGITRIRPRDWMFAAAPGLRPNVVRVAAGDRWWMDPGALPSRVPGGGTGVQVDLNAMGANTMRMYPIRYRLTPRDSEWKRTADSRIRLESLKYGHYKLEAQYEGSPGQPVAEWEFDYGDPRAGYLALSSAAGLALVTTVIGWRRRRWIQYWSRKALYRVNHIGNRRDAAHWNNHTGHLLHKRYEIGRIVSRGGSAIVYRALDRHTGGTVAVKVLHRRPEESSLIRDRFANEVAALHTLDHPGFVQVIDSWISPHGEPCLAMPFVEGRTLHDMLAADGPLGAVEAASLIEQVGDALRYMHESGIVHRDLKPGNIMVTPAGQAVIIDLGSAAMRGPEEELEETRTMTGTVYYLAPERLAGQYSSESDVYSLGVIAVEMLTGKRLTDVEASPAEAEFGEWLMKMAGPAGAADIRLALQHHPRRRPAQVDKWSRQLAAALRNFAQGGSRN